MEVGNESFHQRLQVPGYIFGFIFPRYVGTLGETLLRLYSVRPLQIKIFRALRAGYLLQFYRESVEFKDNPNSFICRIHLYNLHRLPFSPLRLVMPFPPHHLLTLVLLNFFRFRLQLLLRLLRMIFVIPLVITSVASKHSLTYITYSSGPPQTRTYQLRSQIW